MYSNDWGAGETEEFGLGTVVCQCWFLRMESLMTLQQMWGWLIRRWMLVFSSCLVYLTAISIKLCRKRQRKKKEMKWNERKQLGERHRGVCAEVHFYTLLLSSFFLFLAVQNVRDVSALTLEKIVYILQWFWVTCWTVPPSFSVSISFDIKQLIFFFLQISLFLLEDFCCSAGLRDISMCACVCLRCKCVCEPSMSPCSVTKRSSLKSEKAVLFSIKFRIPNLIFYSPHWFICFFIFTLPLSHPVRSMHKISSVKSAAQGVAVASSATPNLV